jgi:predicted RNase H-like HicB family nuclease
MCALPKRGKGRMSYKIIAVIEKDEYGYYAYCPELDGCQTQGDTLREVFDNIGEATELYLKTLSENEARTLLSMEIFCSNEQDTELIPSPLTGEG